jgi:hypothetical protein
MIGYFIDVTEIGYDTDFIWATKEELKHQYSVPKAFKEYIHSVEKIQINE